MNLYLATIFKVLQNLGMQILFPIAFVCFICLQAQSTSIDYVQFENGKAFLPFPERYKKVLTTNAGLIICPAATLLTSQIWGIRVDQADAIHLMFRRKIKAFGDHVNISDVLHISIYDQEPSPSLRPLLEWRSDTGRDVIVVPTNEIWLVAIYRDNNNSEARIVYDFDWSIVYAAEMGGVYPSCSISGLDLPPNGIIDYRQNYPIGFVVKLQCTEGYVREGGEEYAVCSVVGDHLSWIVSKSVCSSVCYHPPAVKHATVHFQTNGLIGYESFSGDRKQTIGRKSEVLTNRKVSYICHEPFVATGLTSLECGFDVMGIPRWFGSPPSCQIPDCSATIFLQELSGSLVNPAYPNSHLSGGSLSCLWEFSGPAGRYIHLSVVYLDLPDLPGVEIVVFNSESTNTNRHLLKLTNHSQPVTLAIQSSKIKVLYHGPPNEVKGYRGFYIRYVIKPRRSRYRREFTATYDAKLQAQLSMPSTPSSSLSENLSESSTHSSSSDASSATATLAVVSTDANRQTTQRTGSHFTKQTSYPSNDSFTNSSTLDSSLASTGQTTLTTYTTEAGAMVSASSSHPTSLTSHDNMEKPMLLQKDTQTTTSLASPSTEPSTSTSTEPSNSPSTKLSTVPSTEPSTSSSTESSTSPSTKLSTVPSAEPSTSPSTEPPTSPSTIPSISPSTEPPTSPSTVPSISPSTEPPTSPSTEPSISPSTEPPTSPSTVPSISPSTEQSTVRSTEPSTVPSTEPPTSPSTKPLTSPSTEQSTVPSTKPSTVRSTEPSTVPSTEPSTSSSTEPSAVPSTEPSTSPSSEISVSTSRETLTSSSTDASTSSSSETSTSSSSETSTSPSTETSTSQHTEPSTDTSTQQIYQSTSISIEHPNTTSDESSTNAVHSISPLSQNTTHLAGTDDSNDNWKIAVGVIIPILFLLLVLVGVYICYRKKYPVRMIIGREFGKFTNPNYSHRAHAPSLVREDADFYFTNGGTLNMPSEDFNPINNKIMYDNMGFIRDEYPDEDEKERKFMQSRSWLFKKTDDESEPTVEAVVETTVESSFITRSLFTAEQELGEERRDKRAYTDTDISEILVDESPKPIPKPRLNKKALSASSSTSDTNNLSNGQLGASKTSDNDGELANSLGSSLSRQMGLHDISQQNADGSTDKEDIQSYVKNTVGLFNQPSFDEVWAEVKARSKSMSIELAPDRSRSLSFDPSKSARKMSLHDDLQAASHLRFLADRVLSPPHSNESGKITAAVVEVDIRDRDSSFVSSVLADEESEEAFPKGRKESYDSRSSLSSGSSRGTDFVQNESRNTANNTSVEHAIEYDNGNNMAPFLKNSGSNEREVRAKDNDNLKTIDEDSPVNTAGYDGRQLSLQSSQTSFKSVNLDEGHQSTTTDNAGKNNNFGISEENTEVDGTAADYDDSLNKTSGDGKMQIAPSSRNRKSSDSSSESSREDLESPPGFSSDDDKEASYHGFSDSLNDDMPLYPERRDANEQHVFTLSPSSVSTSPPLHFQVNASDDSVILQELGDSAQKSMKVSKPHSSNSSSDSSDILSQTDIFMLSRSAPNSLKGSASRGTDDQDSDDFTNIDDVVNRVKAELLIDNDSAYRLDSDGIPDSDIDV